MNAYVLLPLIGGIFGVLPIIWRAKGAHIFLLLCAGSLLSASVSGSITTEIKNAAETDNIPVLSIVQGALLLLPALIGLIISRGTVKKKKTVFHVLPSLASGVLAYLWFIRILPFDQFNAVQAAEVTQQLSKLRDGALVAGILSCLFLIWMDRPKANEEEGKKKGK